MFWLVSALGWALVALVLGDVFLTVLYARAGTGLLTPQLNNTIWWLFLGLARLRGGRRERLLTFAGPVMMLLDLVVWVVGLALGFALIVWPALGSGVQMSQGPTPTDFATALYFSGYALTTLGTGDLVPQTGPYRLLMIFEAVVGFSLFTLTITYFLSVYNALAQRNTLALGLRHRTADTGDAAEFVARLGAGGDLSGAQQTLADLAADLLQLVESHHFYPVLHYMRFREPFYAPPRIMLLVLDTASLLKSALDPERYQAVVRSAALAQVWGGSMHLLDVVADAYPALSRPGQGQESDDGTAASWRERYHEAEAQLRAAGIATRGAQGVDSYITLRGTWEPYIRAFADHLAYNWDMVTLSGRDGKQHGAAGWDRWHAEPMQDQLQR